MASRPSYRQSPTPGMVDPDAYATGPAILGCLGGGIISLILWFVIAFIWVNIT